MHGSGAHPTTLTDLTDAAARDPEGLMRVLRRCTEAEREEVLALVQVGLVNVKELLRRLEVLLALLDDDRPSPRVPYTDLPGVH